jgi:hypothetical protein
LFLNNQKKKKKKKKICGLFGGDSEARGRALSRCARAGCCFGLLGFGFGFNYYGLFRCRRSPRRVLLGACWFIELVFDFDFDFCLFVEICCISLSFFLLFCFVLIVFAH